ncbi:ATP-binding protein [Niallia circulans]|uniref:ATP-binding protein n=1 Tax=Niallia circulans TaxID=1397 RepID=UPI001C268C1E|nr:ATP-binding protein [Niallia circulans]
MKKIHVPRINDDFEDFMTLFYIWDQVKNSNQNIEFDFGRCDFLRQNAVAFLGGMARYLSFNDRQVSFNFETVPRWVYTNLRQNGFIATFSDDAGPWNGNSIPYIETHNDENINTYLENNWLGRGWVNISNNLKHAIVGKVYEIFANVYEHSNSPVGAFSCGQRFQNLNELKLTVVDFGVGIPTKVKNYFNDFSLDTLWTLKWAFTEGNSTRTTQTYKGGLGLGILKDFIIANEGKLEVYSHNGYCIIDKHGSIFKEHDEYFDGTIVNITLKCDENYYYMLEGDNDDDDDFFNV